MLAYQMHRILGPSCSKLTRVHKAVMSDKYARNQWNDAFPKLPSRIILCKAVNKQVEFILEGLQTFCFHNASSFKYDAVLCGLRRCSIIATAPFAKTSVVNSFYNFLGCVVPKMGILGGGSMLSHWPFSFKWAQSYYWGPLNSMLCLILEL